MVESAQAMSDAEVEDVVKSMGSMSLSTDQRNLCVKVLAGRSLSCSQAGIVLGAVKLGIAQRMLAREVLRGRVRGLPQDVEAALAGVSAELRSDVRAGLLGPEGVAQTVLRSVTAPVRTKEPMTLRHSVGNDGPTERAGGEDPWPARRNNWPESVERLRTRVGQEPMSDAMYSDLVDIFQALSLGDLPPPSARGSSVASSRTLESVPPAPASLAPRAPDRPSEPSATSALDRPSGRQNVAAVPPAPLPGGAARSAAGGGGSPPASPARSLKVSALPSPPQVRQTAEDPAEHLPSRVNEGNFAVDDVADNLSEESV